MQAKLLSLIMPVYNEEATLQAIITKVNNVKWPIPVEIIAVNDCSKDGSLKILENLAGQQKNLKVLSNARNMGKSQTVKKGILASQGDLVVIQDSDLEYDPADLMSFLELYKKSDVDVIYGNRFGKSNEVVYVANWIGNRVLSAFSSIFTIFRNGMWTNDMETCYKMFPGEVVREIAPNIRSKTNFGFEPEITAYVAQYKKKDGKHLKFRELSINYYARTVAQGKKMKGIQDGSKALIEIVRFNLFTKNK